MGLSWTMDKIGPICRGVEDCAVALAAIYGPDNRDITVGDAPFNWSPETDLSKMRIGYLKAEFEQGDDKQKAMYKEALEALSERAQNSKQSSCRIFRKQSAHNLERGSGCGIR